MTMTEHIILVILIWMFAITFISSVAYMMKTASKEVIDYFFHKKKQHLESLIAHSNISHLD